ncbi:peptide MFS transporter [Nonomuraea sp. K274]|uniref:Peptide MFS transporter n=1 Tax=Nonomuraea cypriaca TaxID=1187855 RepID=A0A931F3S4_9ACTN|nr:peptide MFS transporter [Nonomuraea cypriaca]MBF8191917.1 peptide MFS transporter [Nonomuraea cypriaca]
MTSPSWSKRSFVTLFMSDLWERFGFYGMMAILVLYFTAPAGNGGLGLAPADSAALVGIYIGLSFMMAMLGGWVGDRVFGPHTATRYGSIILPAGYFVLAIPTTAVTGIGLLLVAVGTAIYKPNLTTMLNLHYQRVRSEREAAISIFYVGIQVSALLAPLVTGFLGERINWHLGFAAAGVTGVICALTYQRGSRHFDTVGTVAVNRASSGEVRQFGLRAAIPALFLLACATGLVPLGLTIAICGAAIILLPFVAYFLLRRHPDLTSDDRRRLTLFLWPLIGSALFWLIAGQDGSMLNLFSLQSTDRELFGFLLPASWLQSATPLFILLAAPLLAWYFKNNGQRVNVAVKFSVGLVIVGASFVIMAGAASLAASGDKVSPLWLLSVYLLHAFGELIIAAVGISAAFEIAPPAFRARMIGVWWLFSALGAGVGSQVVRLTSVIPHTAYYLALGVIVTGFGLAVAYRRNHIAAGIVRPVDVAEVAEEVATPTAHH